MSKEDLVGAEIDRIEAKLTALAQIDERVLAVHDDDRLIPLNALVTILTREVAELRVEVQELRGQLGSSRLKFAVDGRLT